MDGENTKMSIKEICEILRAELYNNGFQYGFIVEGKKYKPNMDKGFVDEYDHLSKTIYTVQDPSVTLKEKIGTCVDTVVVMKSILDNLSVSNKIWLIYNKKKNKVHTILTFVAEGKAVYLELTPQSSKSWYGQEMIYSSEQELLQAYKKNDYDISDVTNLIQVGRKPYFLLNKLN